MMVTRAWENAVYFAPCNKVRHEEDWDFGGISMIIDPEGEILAEAGDAKDEIISATLNREALVDVRRRKPFFRDRRPDLYGPLVTASEDIAP